MKIEITDRELLAIMVGESDPTFYKLQNKMMDIIVECMEQTNAEIRRLQEALAYSSVDSAEYQDADRVKFNASDYYTITKEGRKAYINDGYGNLWNAFCPTCHKKTMEVVRPGKVQCNNEDCPSKSTTTEVKLCTCGEESCEGAKI